QPFTTTLAIVPSPIETLPVDSRRQQSVRNRCRICRCEGIGRALVIASPSARARPAGGISLVTVQLSLAKPGVVCRFPLCDRSTAADDVHLSPRICIAKNLSSAERKDQLSKQPRRQCGLRAESRGYGARGHVVGAEQNIPQRQEPGEILITAL